MLFNEVRELKFRFWNVTNKTMSQCVILTSDNIGNFNNNPYGLPMEYTGLKDVNNKEVYEKYLVDIDGCLCVIEFGQYYDGEYISYGWYGQPIREYGDNGVLSEHGLKLTPSTEMEIIGNIFQNYDLLDDGKIHLSDRPEQGSATRRIRVKCSCSRETIISQHYMNFNISESDILDFTCGCGSHYEKIGKDSRLKIVEVWYEAD